jgi:ABC-type multidrug transport system fused ATPase/permease subunit
MLTIPLRDYTQLLARYLARQRGQMLLLAGLVFGGIALQLAGPQILRYFIDTVQAGGAAPARLTAAALFIVFSLGQRGVSLWADYVAQNVGWRATNGLRSDLALHCLRLDMPFHKTHTPGELIERIDGDVTALANFFSQFSLHVLGNALLVAGILALLFREDWRVGVGLTLYTAFLLISLVAVQRLSVARWAAARQTWAELYGYLEERISGAEDLRAAGAEPYALRRLFALMRANLVKARAAIVLSTLVFGAVNLLFVIGYAGGLGLGVYLFSQGQATIGTAYLIVAYVGMLSSPLHRIREQVQDLQQATASIQRVNELFAVQPQVRDSDQRTVNGEQPSLATVHRSLSTSAVSVEFDQVSFAYDGDDNILREVSFTLPAGRVLGVLGRTGSGKTTLTRLAFRLYDPASGVIRLDDCDLRSVPLAEARACVGLVTQDVQLFQASLRDNLTFFNPRLGDERLERALKELSLWEWARSLPDGLSTRLGAGGLGLSAGEAQLLALTRVFLKDPGLVILDEASSRLDPATENLLERAIDRLLANRTALIIAHRLQTVQRADDILILDEGRVVESGPRVVLANDPNARFYGLLQTDLTEALA